MIMHAPVTTTAPRIIQKSYGKPRMGLCTVSICRMATISASGKVRSAMIVSTRMVSFSLVERSESLVSRSSCRKDVLLYHHDVPPHKLGLVLHRLVQLLENEEEKEDAVLLNVVLFKDRTYLKDFFELMQRVYHLVEI